MIISEIDNIAIHSSLLDKIDLECINAKCIHHSCCHNEVRLTEKDIETIKPVSRIKDFYNIGYNTMRVTSSSATPWKTCVFFSNNTCTLEQLNAKPSACKSFPIILSDNILRLSNKDLPCLKIGSTFAYVLLKDKIIQLTSPEFYKKLAAVLSAPGTELFFRR